MSVTDRYNWTTLGVVELIREVALTRSFNLATSPFTVFALWAMLLIMSCCRRARGGRGATKPKLWNKKSSPLCVLRDALEASLSEAALLETKHRKSPWCRFAKRVSAVAIRAGTIKGCELCAEKAADRPLPLPALPSEKSNDAPVAVASGDQRNRPTARLPILQRLQLPRSETTSETVPSHAVSMQNVFAGKTVSRKKLLTIAGQLDQRWSVKDPMIESFDTVPDNRQKLKSLVRAHRATSAPPRVLGSALDRRST